MKILLAEDDLVSRKVLAKTLTVWGYEVATAENGKQAWEILSSNNAPSIAILDWMMPEMDGLEVIKKSKRSLKADGYTFMILLTGKTEKENLVLGIDAGADDYLTKPFHPDELWARIRAGERIVRLEKKLAHKNNELAKTNRKMKMDLEAAAKIQKTLLPNKIPKLANLNVEWVFEPCDELAGDILNIFLLDERHLALYLLDVSGHGVGAALLSVTLSRILSPHKDDFSILRTWSKSANQYFITPPSEVAQKLNKRFVMNDDSGQYFTLVYGVLDLDTLEYTFVCAGHPNSVLVNDPQKIQTFNSADLPVGLFEEAVYTDMKIQLQTGDRYIIYSDGISEALNENGEQYGASRFLSHISKNHRMSLPDLLKNTTKTVAQWAGHRIQDDISMLALEIK